MPANRNDPRLDENEPGAGSTGGGAGGAVGAGAPRVGSVGMSNRATAFSALGGVRGRPLARSAPPAGAPGVTPPVGAPPPAGPPQLAPGTAPAPGLGGAQLPQTQPSAQPAPAAPKSDLDKLYEQMLASAGSQWGITEQLNQSNMAMMQRKAAAMQGTMGRSVAGGFAGAMGGAYIGGMNQMNAARAQHEQALNALQMSYLQSKQANQQRDEDQALARERFGYEQAKDAGSGGAANDIAKQDPAGFSEAVNEAYSNPGAYPGVDMNDPNWPITSGIALQIYQAKHIGKM